MLIPITTKMATGYVSEMRDGEIIRIWRNKAGWTQTDLAVKSDVSLSTIQKLERSKHVVERQTIRAICEAMGKKLDDFDAAKSIDWPPLNAIWSKLQKIINAGAKAMNQEPDKVRADIIKQLVATAKVYETMSAEQAWAEYLDSPFGDEEWERLSNAVNAESVASGRWPKEIVIELAEQLERKALFAKSIRRDSPEESPSVMRIGPDSPGESPITPAEFESAHKKRSATAAKPKDKPGAK